MPYTTYTRAQIRVLLQDRWEGTPFWTTASANVVINQALRTWNAMTGYWRAPLTVNTGINDPMVPLSGTMCQQTSVSRAGTRVVGCSLAEIKAMFPNWWYARVGATGMPTRIQYWAPAGLNLIALYPAPVVQTTLVVDGVRRTPVLTADGDPFDCGSEELSTLLDYMLHVAALQAGAAFVERTKFGLENFVKAAARRNRFLKETEWYTRLNKEGYAWGLQPEAPVVGADAASGSLP